MQDHKRFSPELWLETIPGLFLENIPWLVLGAAWLGSILMVGISQGRLTGLGSLCVVAIFCLSLAFSRYRNRRWLHKMLTGIDDIGEVTYIDAAHFSWLWFLWAIFVGSLFAALWLAILCQESLPVYPALMIWVTWAGWFLYVVASPIQYIITTKGIGVQAQAAHWFVYFADLQEIRREPGRRLIRIDQASPVVRFRDYVILYLRPERKLPTESRVRYLTPSGPSRFLLHLPPELVKRSDEA